MTFASVMPRAAASPVMSLTCDASSWLPVLTRASPMPTVTCTLRPSEPLTRVHYPIIYDPQVLVHDRALLAGSKGIAVIDGDARHAGLLADDDDLREVIDFARPVGVLLVAVLHFVRDREDPWGSVAALRDRMAPGSYLAVSHGTSDGSDPATVRAIRDAYEDAAAPAVFRTEREIGRFFDGFRLVFPGITDVSQWHPAVPPQPTPGLRIVGGVGQWQG